MPMEVWEFYSLARDDNPLLRGQPVELTGFVVPAEQDGWYLTRMKIFCCAADAAALKVRVRTRLERIPKPRKPYE